MCGTAHRGRTSPCQVEQGSLVLNVRSEIQTDVTEMNVPVPPIVIWKKVNRKESRLERIAHIGQVYQIPDVADSQSSENVSETGRDNGPT